MELSICRFKPSNLFPERVTMYKNHELSMLRLFEAFSENAPQLVLLTPLIMEMQEIQFFTGQAKKHAGKIKCYFFLILLNTEQ